MIGWLLMNSIRSANNKVDYKKEWHDWQNKVSRYLTGGFKRIKWFSFSWSRLAYLTTTGEKYPCTSHQKSIAAEEHSIKLREKNNAFIKDKRTWTTRETLSMPRLFIIDSKDDTYSAIQKKNYPLQTPLVTSCSDRV